MTAEILAKMSMTPAAALASAAEARRREMPASVALVILMGGIAAAIIEGAGTVGWAAIMSLLLILDAELYDRLDARERWWYGLAWLAGVFGFGLAIRSLLPWWLMMLPLVGLAVGSLASPTTAVVITTQRALVVAVFLGLSTLGGGLSGDPWERAGDVDEVVFVQGAVARPDGSIYLTYGAADRCIGAASVETDRLVRALAAAA